MSSKGRGLVYVCGGELYLKVGVEGDAFFGKK